MENPIITLKTKKDQSLRRFHPRVFSGAIKKIQGAPVNGGIVEVQSNHGEFLGLGHWAEGSIAVRVFSFENKEPESSFWLEKLRRAYDARRAVGLIDSTETTMYRLVHAEGDGMPGLIIGRVSVVPAVPSATAATAGAAHTASAAARTAQVPVP